MGLSVQKIIDAYDRGIIVAEECIRDLCKIAAATDPRSFADVIPPEFIGRIRERTADIQHAVSLRRYALGSIESEQQLELEKVQYGEGLRTWKAYFESLDQAKYEDFVRREIEIGLRQTENGEGIPHEEVKRRLARWFPESRAE